MNELNLMAALGLGFLGGAHCIGMCGGVMSALSFAVADQPRSKRISIVFAYNIGRIFSYGLIGLLFGSLGYLLGGYEVLRVVAGALLIAMGLYLANWWRGLTWLERGGAFIWRYIQPLGRTLMPVKTTPHALLLGAIWGWLPCGLVYSALAYAAVQPTPLQAAAFMVAFGLGTLPAVLAGGMVAEKMKQVIQNHNVRVVFALLIIAFGLWTLQAGLPQSHSHHHH